MDDRLERLIRELRNEACPRSVLDQVTRRIARDDGPHLPRRPSLVVSLVGALAVVFVAAGVMWQAGTRRDLPVLRVTQDKPDHARVIEQTQGALMVIGRILIEAGTHAEDALRDEAVPPLLKSFHTAKVKVTQPLL